MDEHEFVTTIHGERSLASKKRVEPTHPPITATMQFVTLVRQPLGRFLFRASVCRCFVF
jgi:hypothetical protein